MWMPRAAVDEGLTCAYRFALSLLAGSGSAAQGFKQTPLVTNRYSDLVNELYVPEAGAHARSSIGMMIALDAPEL